MADDGPLGSLARWGSPRVSIAGEASEAPSESRGMYGHPFGFEGRTRMDQFDFTRLPADERWALAEGARRFQATGTVDPVFGALLRRHNLAPPWEAFLERSSGHPSGDYRMDVWD